MKGAVKQMLLRCALHEQVARQLHLGNEKLGEIVQGADLLLRPRVRRGIHDAYSTDNDSIAAHERCNRVRDTIRRLIRRLDGRRLLSRRISDVADNNGASGLRGFARECQRERDFAPHARPPGETDAAFYDVTIGIEQGDNRNGRMKSARKQTSNPIE